MIYGRKITLLKKWRLPLLLTGLIIIMGLLLQSYYETFFNFISNNLKLLQNYYASFPLIFIAIFLLAYSSLAALFMPVTLIMAIFAGAVFGLTEGLLFITLGNTIAGTANFLISRWVLFERVKENYSNEYSKISSGIEKHGWLYLIFLRLFPFLPAPVINLIVGALPFSLLAFIPITLIFSLPILTAYVLIGVKLASN